MIYNDFVNVQKIINYSLKTFKTIFDMTFLNSRRKFQLGGKEKEKEPKKDERNKKAQVRGKKNKKKYILTFL